MIHRKELSKYLRKQFGKNGWALLIYYGIMNVAVMLVAIFTSMSIAFQAASDPSVNESVMAERILEAVTSNGWGYLIAILIGLLVMFFWKKKEFCFKTIWQGKRPMKVSDFLALLVIFTSGQAVSQLLTPLLVWIFGLMGISLDAMISSASGSSDSISMFLYVCLLAPITEEILFRGLVLRTLAPYGRKFAIFTSAFLFGIFHGNVIQTPYAFLVGLVLGYVTMEHSMLWAMVLHMFNNLLLGDTLSRVTGFMPMWAQQLIFFAVIWGCALIALIVVIVRRKDIAKYLRSEKMHPIYLRSFFTSPGILVLTGVLVGNILLTLL